MLADRITELDDLGNPTLAFLASGIEGLKIRVTARADTQEEADAVLAREIEILEPILGDLVFSVEDRPMEEELIDVLRHHGITVATAESFTGGMVASRLTEIPGSSEVFVGGVVAYDSRVKFELLGVPEGPVVTEECARAMAEGICRVLGADTSVATTGVAGPADQEGKPPGHVCLGWYVDGEAHSVTVRLPGDRDRVREFATISVLNLLRQHLVERSA
jgi:nicotinamide-nucleotide amidase